jgi:hypothetical protein
VRFFPGKTAADQKMKISFMETKARGERFISPRRVLFRHLPSTIKLVLSNLVCLRH